MHLSDADQFISLFTNENNAEICYEILMKRKRILYR